MSILNIVISLLFIPIALEVIAPNEYLIKIPGIPLTFARICFFLIGSIGFLYRKRLPKNYTFIGFIIISFGAFISAFFSDDFTANFSRNLGFFVLLLVAPGFSYIISKFRLFKYIDALFFFMFLYWLFYLLEKLILSEFSGFSYSILFINNEVVNHHIIGLNICLSAVYLTVRFFYRDGSLEIGGYILFSIAIIICFLSETRSNLLITIIMFFFLSYRRIIKKRGQFLSITLFVAGIFYVLLRFATFNDGLYKRFDLSDSEYQSRTSLSRVDFIYSFLNEFVKNPLGKGILDAEVAHGNFKTMMLHNQYLTFVLSGGVVAVFGVLIFMGDFTSLFRRMHKLKFVHAYPKAIIYSALTYFFTLTTLEHTGLIMFLFISLLIWSRENLGYIDYIKKFPS